MIEFRMIDQGSLSAYEALKCQYDALPKRMRHGKRKLHLIEMYPVAGRLCGGEPPNALKGRLCHISYPQALHNGFGAHWGRCAHRRTLMYCGSL